MASPIRLRQVVLLFVGLLLGTVAHAQQSALDSVTLNPTTSGTSTSANNIFPSAAAPNQASASAAFLLHEAVELMQQKQFDAAIEKVNAAVQAEPDNVDCYGLRGGIYAQQKQWDKANKDYLQVLQIDPSNTQAKFNMSEILFMQKNYDKARTGFNGLEKDRNLGDLATYKVFLCDLLAGHEDVATKELADMDQVDSGPSFYFAKAAWALVHKNTDDARTWLVSAAGIYNQAKFKLYAASLFDLGYLPMPPPQKS